MSAAVQFRKTDFLPDGFGPAGQDGVQKKLVIAVDGPAASGKGTLAKRLAERLNFAFLDTGALYRAVGFATLESGGNPENFDEVAPALAIVKRNLTAELLSNPALRTPAVSQAASKVAALPEVRLELLDFQRDFAKNPPAGLYGVVLDGRDIGTIVCPDADIKFFVTAKVEERAKRRCAELKQAGLNADEADVLAEMKERDLRDRSRKIAPTLAADDAYTIDTTTLGVAETLEEAIAIIRAKFVAETAV